MSCVRSIGLDASEDRLEALMAARMQAGADKARIDARIWDLFGEEWAVMFTDLAGFSSGVASFGIIHFLQVIFESQRLLTPCIADHDGIVLKQEGDSLLVIFRRVASAIDCARAMQQASAVYNIGREPAEHIRLCIGLGFGRVLRIGDCDVYGAEVNAAAKLGEDIATSGQILVTAAIRDAAPAGCQFEPIDRIPAGTHAAYRLL